jgi:hypothetical protein
VTADLADLGARALAAVADVNRQVDRACGVDVRLQAEALLAEGGVEMLTRPGRVGQQRREPLHHRYRVT